MLQLDLIQTLACAGVALFIGYGLCRALPLLSRYNLPPAVVGGLAVAVVLSVLRRWDISPLAFDDTLKMPLMTAFFTSIGFRVSVGLLRRGGIAMLLFLMLAIIGAMLQNVIGIVLALTLGQPAIFGVLCGPLTLAGGPATGLAFAPQFENGGIPGAAAVAIVAAICGIVVGGWFGEPISTILIERRGLGKARDAAAKRNTVATEQPFLPDAKETLNDALDPGAYALHKSIALLLVAMCI